VVKLPPGVQLPDIPLERKYRSAVAGLTARIKAIYDAVYDRFGRDGLKLIEEISSNYGHEIAERAGDRVRTNDVKSMATFLLYIFELVSYQSGLEVTEFNDDCVVLKVERCPYPLERPEICRAHTSMEVTLVRTLCPELDYRISRCIPAGDAHCEHVICKRSDPLKSRV